MLYSAGSCFSLAPYTSGPGLWATDKGSEVSEKPVTLPLRPSIDAFYHRSAPRTPHCPVSLRSERRRVHHLLVAIDSLLKHNVLWSLLHRLSSFTDVAVVREVRYRQVAILNSVLYLL